MELTENLIGGFLGIITCAILLYMFMLSQSFFSPKNDRVYAIQWLNKTIAFYCDFSDKTIETGWHLNDPHDEDNYSPSYPDYFIMPNQWPVNPKDGQHTWNPITLWTPTDHLRKYKQGTTVSFSKNPLIQWAEKTFDAKYIGLWPFVSIHEYHLTIPKMITHEHLDELQKEKKYKPDWSNFNETQHIVRFREKTNHIRFEINYHFAARGLSKDSIATELVVNIRMRLRDPWRPTSYSADYVQELYDNVQAICREWIPTHNFIELKSSKNETGEGNTTFFKEISRINERVENANDGLTEILGFEITGANLVDVLISKEMGETQEVEKAIQAKVIAEKQGDAEIVKAKKAARAEKDASFDKGEAYKTITKAQAEADAKYRKTVNTEPVDPETQAMADALKNSKNLTLITGDGKVIPTIDVNKNKGG